MIKKMTLMYLAATCSASVLPRAQAFAFSATPKFAINKLAVSRTRAMPMPTAATAWKKSSHLFMSSAAAANKSEKIPITLLSGFLGAGKTTTLQHLLENTEGAKIGVIVNDVASVNIDAKLVSSKKEGVVELQNGCACCSLADEFLGSVNTMLGDNRNFDAVVVELSGVADPTSIKSNWDSAKLKGHPVTSKADVSQIVTLVDASTFGTDWMTWDVAGERDGWTDPNDGCSAARKVPELLAEQVEAANIIVLNKVDIAGPDQVEVASKLAKSMNDKAIMEEVEYGRVLPTQILKFAVTESEADDDENTSAPSENHSSPSDLGIKNFVYRADRPFNVRKLMTLLNQWPVPIKDDLDLSLLVEAQEEEYQAEGKYDKGSPFVGVLRSKGFCWFAPTRWSGQNEDTWRHDTAMYWSHAGKHFGIAAAGKWWGTVSEEQMKKYFKGDMEEYERIRNQDFVSEEFLDRRQEIVFIGVGLKEEEIRSALDECLLSNKGMDRYRQELNNIMITRDAGS